MKTEPVRSLITGYGLAGAAGLTLGLALGSPLAAALVFWLGGAALTIGVAILAAGRAPAVDPAYEAMRLEQAEAEYRGSAARWEADRASGAERARKVG